MDGKKGQIDKKNVYKVIREIVVQEDEDEGQTRFYTAFTQKKMSGGL